LPSNAQPTKKKHFSEQKKTDNNFFSEQKKTKRKKAQSILY